MDETPIKAGRQGRGKLHTGYFWPLYGDQDEIAFPFAASRAQTVMCEVLAVSFRQACVNQKRYPCASQ